MRDQNDTTVAASPSKSNTETGLRRAIGEARARNLTVVLKPHVDFENDDAHWRGEIGPSFSQAEWASWFGSYVRSKQTNTLPLATENLLENTDGVLRPTPEGGRRRRRRGGVEAPHQCSLRRQPATFLFMLTGRSRDDVIVDRYTAYILSMATLAESVQAELFVVGTELITTERYEAEWRALIAKIRNTTTAKLVYGANWSPGRSNLATP